MLNLMSNATNVDCSLPKNQTFVNKKSEDNPKNSPNDSEFIENSSDCESEENGKETSICNCENNAQLKVKTGCFHLNILALKDAEHKTSGETTIIKTENLKITFKSEDKFKFKTIPPTYIRIIYYISHLFSGSKTIVINVTDYMDLMRIKDREKARETIRIVLEFLQCAAFEWNEKIKKKQGWNIGTRLVESFEFTKRRSEFKVILREEFVKFLNMCNDTKILKTIFAVDLQKNIKAFALGIKLIITAEMNLNPKKAKKRYKNKKPRAWNKLKLSTLLNTCGYKTLEYVRDKGSRHYGRIIADPFENALDELARVSNGMFQWEYCNEKEEELTKEQLKYSYRNLSSCYIRFRFLKIKDEEVEGQVKATN